MSRSVMAWVQTAPVALYRIAISLWVGGMLVVGYLVAPLLFFRLADRALAGSLAGAIFSALAWLGMICGIYLLAFLGVRATRSLRPLRVLLRQRLFWIVVLMFALTLAGHFGVSPVFATIKAEVAPGEVMMGDVLDRFNFWHGVSSGLFGLQTLLGIALVLMQERGLSRASDSLSRRESAQ